jgi:TRAP-type C4-dicarboxylate transport system substrate-binding protein
MPPRSALALALAAAALVSVRAGAEPIKLRFGTIAPTGSAWAHEFTAFARDVEAGTDGAVHIKIYFDGVAGDDTAVIDRIKRDQLDGSMGAESCERLSPSMRVSGVFGLFQSREESKYVMTRLAPRIQAEALKAGFVNFGTAALGPEVIFSRRPIRDWNELRATSLFAWSLDGALVSQARALGMHVVPGALADAARLYEEGRVDGFIVIPTAALAFQYSALTRYVLPLPLSYREGCLYMSSRSFDALPLQAQEYIRAAAAKLRARLDDLNLRQDTALLGGLFAKQGVTLVPVSDTLRLDFFARARELRAQNHVVPDELLELVQSWLADYRVIHQR